MRRDERKGAVLLIAVICVLSAGLWWCGRVSRTEKDSVADMAIETLTTTETDSDTIRKVPKNKKGDNFGDRRYNRASGDIKGNKRRMGRSSGKKKSKGEETGEIVRDILGDTIRSGD